MSLKKFPIGVQDFAKIRNDGKYYVDKTDLIYKLTHTNDYYFLSRPRRFGKSLLVSTLQCYFEGRKDLFTGLAMEKLETEWKKYPVFKLSFAGNKFDTLESLQISLDNMMAAFEELLGIKNMAKFEWGVRFGNILQAAYNATNTPPVVLVDEYDAPIFDSMDNPELQQVLKNEVRKLFSPLKDLGGILRFVFLTGISKFSQLSIFSELNNLNVITMDDEYAAICGITKEEVFTQMQPEIQALADKNKLTYDDACAALQRKYDGYHFSENSPDVFNPFSLINALSKSSLANFWFATGTPTMLLRTMARYSLTPEEYDKGFKVKQDAFDAPTETAQTPIPVLYQSGYLTIKGYDSEAVRPFTLAFPNDEVREGLLWLLISTISSQNGEACSETLDNLVTSLKNQDIDQALQEIKAFMSEIPYDAEKKNELHYKTVVYMLFRLASRYVVRCEEKSAAGRADVVVETGDAVFVFEFKLNGNGTAEDALRQIDDKGYLIPYSTKTAADGTPKKLFKIGVSFDEEKRTIGEWKIVEG